MDVHKMLEQVKAGQLDIAEAEEKLKDLPYEDLGYANQSGKLMKLSTTSLTNQKFNSVDRIV